MKDARYVSQLKRNLISVDALEALGLEVSIRDRVLKMVKGSMVVFVTPRSQGYGDVMATYIREVKTTSRVR